MQTWYVNDVGFGIVVIVTAENVEMAKIILERDHQLAVSNTDLKNVVRNHRWSVELD